MSTRNPGDTTVFVTAVTTYGNPGAGNELSIPAHLNMRSELINLSFLFTADANAGNRVIYIEHAHNSIVNRIGAALGYITASEVAHFICNQSAGFNASTFTENKQISLPHYPIILEGDTIDIRVDNIQATDAITAIFTAWKLWIYEQ